MFLYPADLPAPPLTSCMPEEMQEKHVCKLLSLSHSRALLSVWSHLSGLINLNSQWQRICNYTGAAGDAAEMLHVLLFTNPGNLLPERWVTTGVDGALGCFSHIYAFTEPPVLVLAPCAQQIERPGERVRRRFSFGEWGVFCRMLSPFYLSAELQSFNFPKRTSL